MRGWLDSPPADVIAPGCLLVSGWAFASASPIRDVWVTGLGATRPLQYGLRRDDVATVYPDEPSASQSGFAGYLEFDGTGGRPVTLEVWASLANTRSVRLFKRRLVSPQRSPDSSPIRFAARRALRHPRLLFSRDAWRNGVGQLATKWLTKWLPMPAPAARPVNDPVDRTLLARTGKALLDNFLASGSRLTLATSRSPVVSIILVLWNRAELTFACLRALRAERDVPMEVIVVDNASTDETSKLLARIDGITVITNASNLGFSGGNNIGARPARGEFLLFLNNDADLMPGAIGQLVDTARRDRSIGAVGGKLVFPDGLLQEGGSIVWSDGSCQGYGRGADPTAAAYNFERRVDFCSGALLLTPRSVFEQLGGFDERYRPMYYEDADYCARLWTGGYTVRYQPKAIAIHHEYGSAISKADSIEAQRARQIIFIAQHPRWLASQLAKEAAANDEHLFAARSHPHGQPAVTLVDDAAPDSRMGRGFPRAASLVDALVALGYAVTIYETDKGQSSPGFRLPDVEIVAGGPGGLRAFFAERRHHQFVVVSRPHNMRYVKAAVGVDLEALGAPCVYDAEAIFALREIGRRRVNGQPMPEADSQALVDAEVSLARHCAAVLAVNEAERLLFVASGIPNVVVVGHSADARPTPNPHEVRRTLLFVGSFGHDSPNDDAARFLCRDVMPALQSGGYSMPLVVAGRGIPDHFKALADGAVTWKPDVDDLTPFYDDARVFVVPSRYSAGIPLKIIEAAARGVPVVCTPLVAKQLGWDHGVELLTAESAGEFVRAIVSLWEDRDLWERIRDASLKRVAKDYSPAAFRLAVQRALVLGSTGAESLPIQPTL